MKILMVLTSHDQLGDTAERQASGSFSKVKNWEVTRSLTASS